MYSAEFKQQTLRFSYSRAQMRSPPSRRLPAHGSTFQELAPLVTPNTFIILNKTDLLPTSAQAPTALTSALPQHGWAVSLASQAGTGDFLAGLATALKDRCGRLYLMIYFCD
jgi:hypothetical protein